MLPSNTSPPPPTPPPPPPTSARIWRNISHQSDFESLKRLLVHVHTNSTTSPRPWISALRGPIGDNILHAAAMAGRIEVVRLILENYGDLVNKGVEGKRYKGETALHIAAIKGNLKMVELLLNHGADPFAMATGEAFCTGFGGALSLYFGMTVLQFAACAGHLEIMSLLVKKSGDPKALIEAVDLNGNNVFHVLATRPSVSSTVVEFLKRKLTKQYVLSREHQDGTANSTLLEPGRPAIGHGANAYLRSVFDQPNKIGLSSLQVGMSKGNAGALDMLRFSVWEFGDVRSSRIPISGIDSLLDAGLPRASNLNGGASVWKDYSALEIATATQNLDAMSHPVMNCLLKAKWYLYARRKFLQRMVLSILLMSTFTAALALQPSNPKARYEYGFYNNGESAVPVLRVVFEAATVIGVTCLMFYDFRNLVDPRAWRLRSKGLSITLRLEKLEPLAFGILIYICTIFRLSLSIPSYTEETLRKVRNGEDLILGAAAIIGWISLLHFANGFSRLGPLTLTFRKILLGDLLEWAMIYSVFTIGFGCALFLLMLDVPRNTEYEVADWDYLPGSVLWTIRFIFAQAVFDDFRKSHMPGVTQTLFLAYAFLVMVLLFNVLIAMLSQTFGAVAQDSNRLWLVQFGRIIVEIDSRLTQSERAVYAAHLGHLDTSESSNTRYITLIERRLNPFDASAEPSYEVEKVVIAYESSTTSLRPPVTPPTKTRGPTPSSLQSDGTTLANPEELEGDAQVEVHMNLGYWRSWWWDLFVPGRKRKENLWNGHPLRAVREEVEEFNNLVEEEPSLRCDDSPAPNSGKVPGAVVVDVIGGEKDGREVDQEAGK
ncbi:hypothetical protein DFJ73DRAFT_339333 [Zopfochytrium polystomum]|nr:hypothetical protein DFJ73DRAFT_339333 [Zopfochytrium polystomum]